MAAPEKNRLLNGLPIEILLEIYQHLDLQAVFELSLTNTEFFLFLQRHKVDIILPVLSRDFSPFNELLQVHTASAGDVANGGQYKPRKIVFKRFAGHEALDFSQPSWPTASSDQRRDSMCMQVNKGHKTVRAKESRSDPIVLTEEDLDILVKQCRLVREWEELFPHMRWYHQPEDCRLLRPHEQVRFRRALYRWWMYGVHFHGDFPRPQIGHPEPYVDDIRTSQMRYYSTAELLELMDLLETINDVILHYICPQLDPTHNQYSTHSTLPEVIARDQSLMTSWNDQSSWGRIVKTYAKLGPEELLHYFNNIYSYPRKRLITEVQVRHPNFTFDQASVQIAVRCALDERDWLDKKIDLAEHGVGGIIDFDDERDENRQGLQTDASPNGQLPGGSRLIRSYSRYSPMGDDGSFLEDYLRLSGFDSRVPTATTLEAMN